MFSIQGFVMVSFYCGCFQIKTVFKYPNFYYFFTTLIMPLACKMMLPSDEVTAIFGHCQTNFSSLIHSTERWETCPLRSRAGVRSHCPGCHSSIILVIAASADRVIFQLLSFCIVPRQQRTLFYSLFFTAPERALGIQQQFNKFMMNMYSSHNSVDSVPSVSKVSPSLTQIIFTECTCVPSLPPQGVSSSICPSFPLSMNSNQIH